MPGNYDGSVVINTELDNSGFDKGSKELESALKEMTAEIKAMGQNLQQSFEKYAQSVQSAVTASNGMADQMGRTQQSANELGSAVDQAKGSLDQLKESGAGPIVDLEEPKKSVSQLDKEIASLQKQVGGLDTISAKAADGNAAATEKLKSGYAAAVEKLNELAAKTVDLGNTRIPSDDYKWLSSEIDKVDAKLEKLQDKEAKFKALGVSETSQGFKSLQYDIDQCKANLQDLIATKKQMEADGSAFISGVDTQNYQQARAQLESIKAQLDTIRQKSGVALPAPESTGWARLKEQVKGSASAFSQLMRAAGSGLASRISEIGSKAATAARHLASMAKSGIISGLKRLGSALIGVGRSAGSSSNGLAGGLKNMLKYGLGIRSLFVLINKLRSAIVSGLGGIAAYSSSFNSVISSFIGSLKTLGNSFAAAFAPVLSVVLPILTTLINCLADAVNRIGMMIAALTGRKSFIKATKVQYNFADAQGATAQGASDAAGALDDEAAAAEEAKKQLMGFDDVNILQQDKTNSPNAGSGGGGGGGGGDGGAGGFEEVPVDDVASAWADMLKEAWENADFTEIGRILGEKLRDALESIPWDKIKATLRKIAKCIATFLNGFLETPGLFTVIGKTIAEGLNSAFEFVDSFIQNFHWDSLGKAIKDGIIGFCTNIDWPLIYRTFKGAGAGIGTALESALDNPEIWETMLLTASNGINAVAYGLNAFISSVNWGSLGKNIATGLNAGIANLDWSAISDFLILGVNGVFDLWYNFVTTFDFLKFGKFIGTAIAEAIKGINWKTGAYSVGATISGLFDALDGFVQGIDWEDLGRAVVDVIAGFFGGFNWSSVGSFISHCVQALYDYFSGVVEHIDWEAMAEYLINAICDFLKGFDWSGTAQSVGKALGNAFTAVIRLGGWLWNTMVDFGKNVIKGLQQGITNIISSIASWIKKNIFDPFINGFKNAFGIHSPSTVMAELGRYIIEGLHSGITNSWSMITSFFSGCGQSIAGVFDGLASWWQSIGSWIVSGIQTGIANAWGSLTSMVTSWCADLWDSIINFFQIGSPSKLMRRTVGRWIPPGIAEGIKDTSDTAFKAVHDLATGIADEAESTSALLPIEATVSDGVDGLDGVLGTFADKVSSSFRSLLASLDQLVSDAGFTAPAMSQGSIMPYSAKGSAGTSWQDAAEAFAKMSSGSITKEELRSMLTELGRKIDAISFYIGDENLARHVNKGNVLLDRRYKTVG